MKKIIAIAAILLMIAIIITRCSGIKETPPSIQDKTFEIIGTVQYINLEGGFWGIVDDDGKNYEPVDLPEALQKNNLRAVFQLKILEDQLSFRMWGTVVEVANYQIIAISSTPGPKIGLARDNIAPDFQLQDLDGNLVKLSDFRGKVVLLNFWASWCDPCRREMPSIEKIYQDYKDRGFVVLAINIQEDRETVRDFMKSLKLSFLALLDFDGIVSMKYQVLTAIPLTYLIDSQGRVQGFVVGDQDWADSAHREIIEKLLPNNIKNGSD